MSDLITFAIGFGVIAIVAYAFYVSGREKAQGEAFYTICELRREVRAGRLENERLKQRLNGIPRGDAYRVQDFGAGL